jgi:hypothetical protein
VTAPVCPACRGVAVDPDDGSECPECEGSGANYFDPSSKADRAEVASRIVADFGALAACEAAGMKLEVRDPHADYAGALEYFDACFDEDFGSSRDRKIGVGLAGVSTLETAMREAVKACAVRVLFEQVADARAEGDEDNFAEADAAAIRGAA